MTMPGRTGADQTGPMSDAECEAHLQDLLGGLSDEEVRELAALAEAMHAEGGD